MRVDVRARVLWGDPIETIREAWLVKGAPSPLLNSALEDAVLEREKHFRKRGLQDLGIGVACFCLGALAALFHYALFHGQIETTVTSKEMALVWIAMVALPLAGLHFSFRGVRRLATGGSSEGAASDLSEFDHFSKN
jgi:hypothetical protein